MRDVVILALSDGEACEVPRVPVLACADALRTAGAGVSTVTAGSDGDIDAALKPVEAGEASLVVAAASDGEVRAVVRRLVRRYAPPPSKRPAELPAGRTVLDLPPLAILPLTPAVPPLAQHLGLPVEPAAVASAVLAGTTRRLDLLRTDAGSVTLHGSLLGGVDASGAAVAWRGRVEVDDAILTDGEDPVFACSIRNVGSSQIDGLPLVPEATPDDGVLDVAIAVPVLRRRTLRKPTVQFEVRRAHGRAVSVTPREAQVPLHDDGVTGTLNRKRAWWIEHGAWAVYLT